MASARYIGGSTGSRSPKPFIEAKPRSEEHTSELQSPCNLVCRLLLEKKKTSHAAMDPLLKAVVVEAASEATRESFRQRIVVNPMNEVAAEIDVEYSSSMPMDIPDMHA